MPRRTRKRHLSGKQINASRTRTFAEKLPPKNILKQKKLFSDIKVSHFPEREIKILDFSINVKPTRRRKSSIVVTEQGVPIEATLRFTGLDYIRISKDEAEKGMKQALFRSNPPKKVFIAVIEEAKNLVPHIDWVREKDITPDELINWIIRLTNEYKREFPKDVRIFVH